MNNNVVLNHMLSIVLLTVLSACTQNTPLPGDDAVPAVPSLPPMTTLTTTVVSSPTTVIATKTAPGSILMVPTQSPQPRSLSTPSAAQIGTPLLFVRDNDLWRAGLDGKNEQRLTTGELLAGWFELNGGGDFWWAGGFPPQIHVSPDGRWLAFTQTGRNLVLVSVTEQEPVRMYDLGGWATIFTWAPDSQRLAYSTQSGTFTHDVATGSSQQLLGQDGGNLVWSPDGRFLALSCCFDETQPGPFEGTYKGEVRQVELATQEMTTVGETWVGIASGSPPLCWSAVGKVGIDISEPLLCSFERPYPYVMAPDGEHTAVLAARTPDDDGLFQLLLVQDTNTDATLWQREVPQAQTVFWSPDGQALLLGNSHYNQDQAAIWHIPADGSSPAQLLLPGALLLEVVPLWQEM